MESPDDPSPTPALPPAQAPTTRRLPAPSENRNGHRARTRPPQPAAVEEDEDGDAFDLEEGGHGVQPKAVAVPSRERKGRHRDDEDDDDHSKVTDASDDSEADDGDADRGNAKRRTNKNDDGKEKDDGGKQDDKRWSPLKKGIVFGILALIVIVALVITIPWYLNSRHFEQTDDAFIDAHVTNVAPQVDGRVRTVNVADNQEVKAGDVLLTLDPADFQAALDQAQGTLAQANGQLAQAQAQREVALANVEQSKADVEQAQSTLDNATSQLQRYEGLSREAVSPQRLDDLRTAVRNDQAQLVATQKKASATQAQVTLADSEIEAAKANVKAASARVEQSQLNLSYTTVKASVDGRVTQKSVQVGDYLQAGQRTLIVVPHEVWVTANFKETQLTDMRPGQPVDITVDSFPDETFHGKVDSVQAGSGTVFSLLPPQNATGNYVKVVQRVPVKITFDDTRSDTYARLGPGMSVAPKVRVR